MRALVLGAALAAGAALVACGPRADQPQSLADATTKAIYNDDVNGMQARFDDDLRKQVTLDQVALLSGKLHALGGYHGLSQTAVDAAKGRYDYAARFDQATIPVHVRLDPDGRIGAFRFDVPEPVATR
jgi:hypothetical protein